MARRLQGAAIAQNRCGVGGTVAQALKLIDPTRNIDVANLAARAGFLTVEVNLGARLSLERQRVDTEDILVLATQVVLHDGDLVQHGGIA